MKRAHLSRTPGTFAVFAFAALLTTACAAERALSPQQTTASIAAPVATSVSQVPLLYVVDGIRLQRDQVPALSSEQIASVRVIKGRAALKQYGPDASYGVVLITTKAAVAPRS
ncbi:MAG: hypothetical protein ACJ8AE_12875 [Gemmatimonadaceae bacterium]